MNPVSELTRHIKSKILKKDDNEEFKQKKPEKMSTTKMVLSIIFCLLSLVYMVYLFIFQIECIIHDGSDNGKIKWGTVVLTVLLFMCCGPCMFLYRLIKRCKPANASNNSKPNARQNVAVPNNTPKVPNAPRNNAARNNAARNNVARTNA